LTKITQEMLSSVEGMSSRAAAAELGVSKTAINDARARTASASETPQEPDTGYRYAQGYDGTVEASTAPSEAPVAPEQAADILRDHGLDPEQYNVTFGFSEWMQGDKKLHSMRVKATPKPVKEKSVRLDADELIAAIESNDFIRPVGTGETSSESTFVLCPSDLQFGKTDGAGGTPETIARVRASLERARIICESSRYSTICIVEAGDIVENFYNTSGQRETNDLDITGQIRIARRIMLEIIMTLAPLTDNLVYVSVPSNHSAVRVDFKGNASNPSNDYGIEIGYQLEDVLYGRPEYSHVTFVRPEGLHESVAVSVSSTRLGVVHGHQAKGSDKIGSWWQGQSHGRMPVGEADILITGHYHSLRVQHSGDRRWIMVAPSSDNGSMWYSVSTGEQSQAGMLSFVTKDGQWSDLRIL
jgi:predicted phosphodiesterase